MTPILYNLSDYQFIEISGQDALTFTQSQVTCDLRKLEASRWQLGAQCNPKGRMVMSFLAFQNEQGVVLRVHASLGNALDGLKKYAVFTKVKLNRIDLPGQALVGEGIVDKAAAKLGLDKSLEVGTYQAYDRGFLVVRAADWLEFYGTSERLGQWIQTGLDSAAIKTASEFDAELIRRGIAEVRAATAEEYIPQMFNYEQIDAVSFKKGCYTGQEVVARMQYLGKLKKHLYLGRVNGGHLPVGAQLAFDQSSEPQGVIVMSCANEFLAVVNDQAKESPSLNCPLHSALKIEWIPLPYAIPM